MKRIESAALLVRSVPYGEADVIATFFSETEGKLSAIVRGARRSTKRFGGALEPIHELLAVLEDRGKELCTLKEARLVRVRHGIVADLAKMDAAGRALRWVRHLCPARTPEQAVWTSLRTLLDTLDGLGAVPGGELAQHLAVFALQLLANVGYGLNLDACIRCGKPCPAGRPAFVDPAAGGLVCMDCGGARRTLSADVRALGQQVQDPGGVPRDLGSAPAGGTLPAMTAAQANVLLAIAEEAMSAHAGFRAEGSDKP